MKKVALLLFAFLFCVTARAGSLITATVTVTNTPADGDTITINGSARTWKTSVATPSSQITIGASIGANATNMFNQFAGTSFTALTLNRSGTNGVTLRGSVDQTITVSISGTWGSYTLSTNTTAEGDSVRVPISSYQTGSKGTNIASQLASDLGTYSTNALSAGTTLLNNIVQTSGTQTVAGTKTFTGANVFTNSSQAIYGGTLTNVAIGASGIWVTNLYGYGALNVSNTTPRVIVYETGASADQKATYIESSSGFFKITAYSDAGVAGDIGFYIERSGTSIQHIGMPNGELLLGSQVSGDGLQLGGTAKLLKLDHTTLSTGNNANVSFGATVFAKIASGPGGAFTINGIANGEDGKVHIIYNATGYNMTIANDSGVDPTPANRIYTNTGADVSTTGNGCVTVIYDETASRWIVTALQQ